MHNFDDGRCWELFGLLCGPCLNECDGDGKNKCVSSFTFELNGPKMVGLALSGLKW